MPAHLPARTRLLRGEEGLRLRRLRRVHRARRRRPRAQLPLPGGPGRRARGHHRGGPRHRRGAAPGPAAVPRRPGLPVRLLHRRVRHDDGGARRGPARRPAPGAQGQPVPLHRLPGHLRRRPRCHHRRDGVPGTGGRGERGGPRRPAGRHRHRPLHARRRRAGCAAHEAAALAARARPGRRDRHRRRAGPARGAGRVHPRGRAAAPVLQRPAREPGGRPGRHPRARRRRAPRRAARRRRGGRHRGRRGGGLPPGPGDLRGAARRHRSRGGPAPRRAAGAGDGQRGGGGARGGRRRRGRVRGGRRRVRADVPHPARAARQPRDARCGRLAGGRRLAGGAHQHQVPFLTRRALCDLFDLPAESVRVVAGRVGGGFGGKQEMLVEDVVTLAVLQLRRPVRLEFTRAEQFVGATTRHPFTVRVKVGARADGTLTAIQVRAVSDTGAYGNHGPAVMFHAVAESLAVYTCPHKKVDGFAVHTHTVPSGAFRGYGLGQVTFAVESAIDELARTLGLDPLAVRERNILRSGDPVVAPAGHDDDLHVASYGLDQCLDVVRAAAAEPAGPVPEGWLVGSGSALSMIATGPPGGHTADVVARLLPDGAIEVAVGTTEFGNGTTTVHRQIAADALGTRPDRITVRQSDTDLVGHDTGAFGSTGTVVAGKATLRAAHALAGSLRMLAAQYLGVDARECVLVVDAVQAGDRQILLKELHQRAGRDVVAHGTFGGTPRSVAFNVQWFRVAVDPGTGEIRILRSVHAADAGRVLNPMQCRGQVEGGVAQALGAAQFEQVRLDADGRVTTTAFREYRLPAFADVPPTEVHFVDTTDAIGPLGAKSMSESPFNPVAPALANAVRDATGVRFTDLPLARDTVWLALDARRGSQAG
ncbi:molybdopterin cofactor-binding domain-containing protein [Pseudonocardia sp. 73-21]|uniref:xanthine dehydrogenase family protein molybdopterin-binding subunit n=1 Tax=Pseudonocardia sp. 73-21 TaxID=1895809 RepID=UPI0034382EC0